MWFKYRATKVKLSIGGVVLASSLAAVTGCAPHVAQLKPAPVDGAVHHDLTTRNEQPFQEDLNIQQQIRASHHERLLSPTGGSFDALSPFDSVGLSNGGSPPSPRPPQTSPPTPGAPSCMSCPP